MVIYNKKRGEASSKKERDEMGGAGARGEQGEIYTFKQP